MAFNDAGGEAMSLAGKVVLVTGAARGMGREYVRGFLNEGASVIATDLSWAPSGFSSDEKPFLTEVRENPGVLADVMDITIDAHIKRVYQAAMDRFGTIDAIVNNAGMRQRDLYPPHGSVTTLETEIGDWQRMFDTHVFGTLRVIKSFVQPMLDQGRGSIINVASDGYNGWRPASREMPYQAAKAGLVTMALYLAHELKPHNIAVNVLLPGHTRSTGSDEQEAQRAKLRAATGAVSSAATRLRPEHVVPLALYLAREDGSGTTAQVIKAMDWNAQNGLGGVESWRYVPESV
jgi:NAD(P)-dependent dehydrogenase (short-subunit alcohol dehydrogenase family)